MKHVVLLIVIITVWIIINIITVWMIINNLPKTYYELKSVDREGNWLNTYWVTTDENYPNTLSLRRQK